MPQHFLRGGVPQPRAGHLTQAVVRTKKDAVCGYCLLLQGWPRWTLVHMGPVERCRIGGGRAASQRHSTAQQLLSPQKRCLTSTFVIPREKWNAFSPQGALTPLLTVSPATGHPQCHRGHFLTKPRTVTAVSLHWGKLGHGGLFIKQQLSKMKGKQHPKSHANWLSNV